MEITADLKAEALRTLATLENHFGIELQSLFTQEHLSTVLFKDLKKEYMHRITAGINAYQGYQFEQDDNMGNYRHSEDDTEFEPNIFMTRHNALLIADFTGNKVTEYVTMLSKRLENLAASSSVAQFVATTLGSTFVAVGVPVAIATVKNLIAKQALKAALTGAIKSVGLKSGVAAVALALLGLLYYLIWEVEAKILGIIINDTDTDYYVPNWQNDVNGYESGNLYMEHGTTKNFMHDNLNGNIDSPMVQLKSRFVDEDDEKTMVAAGIYFAEKRAGFVGAEGTYVFIAKEGKDPGFAYGFAVPYSKKNGANIRLYTGGTISDVNVIKGINTELYDSRQVNVDYSQGNVRLRSHVSSDKGGSICGVASISVPLIYQT